MTEITKLTDAIQQRVENVDPSEAEATAKEMLEIIRDWTQTAKNNNGELFWSKKIKKRVSYLLRHPVQREKINGRWNTLMSMRDVQPPTPVFINSDFTDRAIN